MEKTFIFAGFGGQGMLLIGKFMAMSCMLDGKHVSWLPSYGPEMRGGTASCSVIISDTAIGSPLVPHPDILIAMNLPSLDRFEDAVAPGGMIFYDSSLIERAVKRRDRLLGIETLFESRGAFGAHAKLACGDTHVRTAERRALEYDRLSGIGDAGVCAAHDAGKRDRLVIIRNDEHRGIERVLDIVKRNILFAVGGAAHVDVASVEAGVVECMHRLTVLEHDVVCYIDDVVDRAHSGGAEAAAHPHRGGRDPHVQSEDRKSVV